MLNPLPSPPFISKPSLPFSPLFLFDKTSSRREQVSSSLASMFDLHQYPSASAPLKRVRSSVKTRLAKDRFVPDDLPGEPEDYLVDLIDEDDPANAKSWPFKRKMIACAILGFDTLVASWGSSVYSAAVQPVSAEFHVGSVVAILGLTLYICGFATGPLAWAPLSEIYGRKWPITFACAIFTCFMVSFQPMILKKAWLTNA